MIHPGNFLHTLERFLVVDLEATCWSKNETKPEGYRRNEVIEIGACLYLARKSGGLRQAEQVPVGTVLGSGFVSNIWQLFVQPKSNPQLGEFCKKLTKIGQERVDQAPSLEHVWRNWKDVLESLTPFIFTSWGDFDYSLLKEDLQHVGVTDTMFPIHLNLKNYFGDTTGWRRLGLGEALKKVGLVFEGQQHSGVDDAYNTARVLDWLVQQEGK
jgi:inhibitor of KinA sporulation pathway (predicted exonuclease)